MDWFGAMGAVGAGETSVTHAVPESATLERVCGFEPVLVRLTVNRLTSPGKVVGVVTERAKRQAGAPTARSVPAVLLPVMS